MRRDARVDANQGEIRETFRSLGCSVHDTYQLGGGFGDLVIGLHGYNVIIEIKDGSKPASARKLTDKEREFSGNWLGEYRIIKSVDEVIALVKEIRKRKPVGTKQ